MIGDVLHLIDQSHRSGIAAEKFERRFSHQARLIEFRDKLCPAIDDLLPTLIERREIRARFSRPE